MQKTPSLRPRDLVMLQRGAGNQAVGRLLQVHASEPPASDPSEIADAEPPAPAAIQSAPTREPATALKRIAAAVGLSWRWRLGGPAY
jgi:hypothetical protein